MSSMGTGYDLSTTTYSPDGRVFQVEFASKAVENSGTAIGVRCKNGVVVGVEKPIASKMLEEGAVRRVFMVEDSIGIAISGLVSDARAVVNDAMKEAANHRSYYGEAIPGKVLADHIAMYLQTHTTLPWARPFGVSIIIISMDAQGKSPELFVVEPSGVVLGHFACAVGKHESAAKSELEKEKWIDMDIRQGVDHVARIIYAVHDELKDKNFELEMAWVSELSNGRFELVPQDIFHEAEEKAKKAKEEMDE